MVVHHHKLQHPIVALLGNFAEKLGLPLGEFGSNETSAKISFEELETSPPKTVISVWAGVAQVENRFVTGSIAKFFRAVILAADPHADVWVKDGDFLLPTASLDKLQPKLETKITELSESKRFTEFAEIFKNLWVISKEVSQKHFKLEPGISKNGLCFYISTNDEKFIETARTLESRGISVEPQMQRGERIHGHFVISACNRQAVHELNELLVSNRKLAEGLEKGGSNWIDEFYKSRVDAYKGPQGRA